MNLVDLIIAAAVFGLVMALWTMAVLVWNLRHTVRQNKIDKRLHPRTQAGPTKVLRLWHDGRETTATVAGVAQRITLVQRLEKLRHDAGWVSPVRSVVAGLLGGTLLMFVVPYALTGRVLAGACGSVSVVLISWAYVNRQINRRISMFEMQLVDSLELAARSLRAGHPLLGAFRLIAEEVPQPVGPVFAEICQLQAMGMSLEDAVRQVASKSFSQDMKLFATSVVIQLRSGGNLADMMERLALVIRDRIRLNRRVRVLTSQTQFSKRILIAMPFVVFLVLNVINPKYVAPLYNTFEGQVLLAIAACLLLMGTLVMNWMVRVR